MLGLWGQKDVWLGLEVSVFWHKIAMNHLQVVVVCEGRKLCVNCRLKFELLYSLPFVCNSEIKLPTIETSGTK